MNDSRLENGGLDTPSGNQAKPPALPEIDYGAPMHTLNPLHLGKGTSYYGHCRNDVIDVIGQQQIKANRIIELGCSSGATGEKLKETLHASYYVGVDYTKDAIDLAKAKLDAAFVLDLQTATPDTIGLKQQDFDLLIGLDVFEHLYDPWEILARWKHLLRIGGHAVLSIPNVQHMSVVGGLGDGQFRYAKEGLLDSTHIRFFTKQNILELLQGAGLTPTALSAVFLPQPNMSQVRETGNSIKIGRMVISELSREEMLQFFVFQYICVARRDS